MDVISEGFKRCSKCGEIKPFAMFRKSKLGTFGLTAKCKSCLKEYEALYKQQNREKVLEGKRRYREANREQLRLKANEYTEKNREQRRERAKAIYHSDPAKHQQLSRDYYYKNHQKQLEYRQEQRKKNRAYNLNYGGLYRERNRQKLAEDSRKYKQTERGKLVTRTAYNRREARKQNLPSDFTVEQWQKCLAYFDHRCVVCGRPEGNGFRLAIDHWIPLSSPNCPGSIATNLIPLCHSKKGTTGSCNLSKHTKDPQTRLVNRFGEEQAQIILNRIQEYFTWVNNQNNALSEK